VIIKVDRNYLEINSIKELIPSSVPNDKCKLFLVNPPDFQLNKFFYKQIGKDYRWVDRLVWDDNKWINYVANPNLKTYILKDDDNLIGYFEIIFEIGKKVKEDFDDKKLPLMIAMIDAILEDKKLNIKWENFN